MCFIETLLKLPMMERLNRDHTPSIELVWSHPSC